MKVYYEETRKAIISALVFLLLWVSITSLITANFKYLFINLHSVEVPDHKIGEDPKIKAWRQINSDFWGYWTVTIREARTNRYICSTRGPTIQYRAEASKINPIEMELSSWMNEPNDLKMCAYLGLEAGVFYLHTCHHKLLMGITRVSRCVDSNPFTRYEVAS